MDQLQFELSESLASTLAFDSHGCGRSLPTLDALFFELKPTLSVDDKLDVLHRYGQLEVLGCGDPIKLFAHNQKQTALPVTEAIYSEKEILGDRELSHVWIEEMISTESSMTSGQSDEPNDQQLATWKYNAADGERFRDVEETRVRELLKSHSQIRISAYCADDMGSYDSLAKDLRFQTVRVPTKQINWYKIVIDLFLANKLSLSLKNLIPSDDGAEQTVNRNVEQTVALTLSTIGDVLVTKIVGVPCPPTSLNEFMYGDGLYPTRALVLALKILYLKDADTHSTSQVESILSTLHKPSHSWSPLDDDEASDS